MRTKRRQNKKLAILAVLLLLCVAAAVYAVKLVGSRAEQRQAEAEAQAAQEQAEAEAAEAAEAEAEEAAPAVKPDSVYSNRGSGEDELYTMASYESAVEKGSGVLAFPFVVSQSGTPYVANDDLAQDLTGTQGYFSGMTDGQIDELETRSGSKLIKVSDLFDKYGSDVKYVIELKYTGGANVQALGELVEKYELGDNVMMSCQYFSGLTAIATQLPEMKMLFICANDSEFNEALAKDYVDEISVSREYMSAEDCEIAHARGKRYGVWTLNTEAEIEEAIKMGVDSYYTDETAMAVKAEGKRSSE